MRFLGMADPKLRLSNVFSEKYFTMNGNYCVLYYPESYQVPYEEVDNQQN